MKPYEFMRFFHSKLGRFVYKHKGSGIIVDNISKPLRSVASSLAKTIVKQFAKKALQSGISHAGDKLVKKAAEKSGDLIMNTLANRFAKSKPQSITTKNYNGKTEYSSETRGINRHDTEPFDIYSLRQK